MFLNRRLKGALEALDGRAVANPSVDGSAVFLIEAGTRRWITSPLVLERLGFKPSDVQHVEAQLLLEIPKGEPIGGSLRSEIRYEVASPYLTGSGIELGGGTSPQRVPVGSTITQFDKRSVDELAQYFQASAGAFQPTHSLDELPKRFPSGADFLVAHHVLEHCSDPIGELARWHGYLRQGGAMVVSVPHVDHCPDRGRHVPPLEHLLLDYLLDRGDDVFESREHVYSFLMGWCDDGFGKGIDKFELARKAHECANRPGNDLHWHAFRPGLLAEIIDAAAAFSGARAEVKVLAGPDVDGDSPRTEGEIICVYRLVRMPAHVAARSPATAGALSGLETKLARALARLQAVTTTGPAAT